MVKFSSRADIALASKNDIKRALTLDASILSTDIKAFISANEFAYDIGINTWLMMIRDYSSKWESIRIRIITKGLRASVLEATKASDFVLRKLTNVGNINFDALIASLWDDPNMGLFIGILQDVRLSVERIINKDTSEIDVTSQTLAIFLSLMRYLKRMSPIGSDRLYSETYINFKSNQNRLKLKDRYGNNPLIESLVRDEIMSMINWKLWVKRVSSLKVSDIALTHGVGFDARADRMSKLDALRENAPVFYDLSAEWSAFWPLVNCNAAHQYTVKIQAVPKTFKIARTIAMEPTYRQALAKRVFMITDELLQTSTGRNAVPASEGIDLHNQGINQELSREGSICSNLATIDLSHASDDVRDSLVTALFPHEVVEILSLLRPKTYEIGSASATLYSWATMGHSMTFVIESLVFLAIARAAVSFAERHGFGKDGSVVRTYGDDIIVPDWAATTVIAFLEELGFIPNEDKSWIGDIPYRESCGAEWLCGRDISAIYFPRFSLSGSLGSVHWDGFKEEYVSEYSRLVSLQHRIFDISEQAARYITFAMRDCDKRVPSVPPHIDVDALWDYDSTIRSINPPAAKVVRWRQFDVYRFITITGLLDIDVTEYSSIDLRRYIIRIPVVRLDGGKLSELIQIATYQEYLKHGPMYATALDELLGVSTSRLTLIGTPKIYWDVHEIDIG